MFIQNRAKSIAQRLNAKNIAPLRERIAEFADKIAESSVEITIGDIICVDLIDSALDSANQNNSSLRNFAKQSCGNPQGFARAVARSNHPPCENNAESQGGLPRSHSLARNDNSFLTSAESQNLGKNILSLRDSAKQNRGNPPIKKNIKSQSGLPRSHSLARNDNFLDSSHPPLPQNDKIEAENDNLGARVAESNKNSPSLAEGARGWVNSTQIADSTNNIFSELESLLQDLKPWRKGPFNFCGIEVQSEWDSAIKFNIIAPHLSVGGKVVADVGCNNGYYAFRLLPLRPSKIVGFEPSAHCKMQFDLINAFVKSEICFEMLGVEDLADYDCKFDCILCLGVLYHRTNPLDCLKILKNALNPCGELIIDTLIIEGEDEIVLSPLSYAKMKNVYFIPSIRAFQNWLKRAGFKEIELLEVRKTTSIEQRKTAWSGGESLEDFLDKNDKNKTIEGYNAPTRAYFKAKI